MWSHKLLSVLRTGLLDLHYVSHHLRQNIIAETPRHVTPRVMTPRSPSQSRLLSSDCGDVPPSSLATPWRSSSSCSLCGQAGQGGREGWAPAVLSVPPHHQSSLLELDTHIPVCHVSAWHGLANSASILVSPFFLQKMFALFGLSSAVPACLWFFGFASRN